MWITQNRTGSGQEDPKPYKQALWAMQGSSAMIWYNDYCQGGLFFHVFVSFSSNFLLLPNFMHQRSKDKRSGPVWRQQTPLHQERVSKGALWGTACRMHTPAGFLPASFSFVTSWSTHSLRANCMKNKTPTAAPKEEEIALFQFTKLFPSHTLCVRICASAQNHIKYWIWIDIL